MEERSETALYRSRFCLIALILVGWTAFAFWPLHRFDFVNYDDDRYIVKNPILREGLSWKGVKWAFAADLIKDSPHADYWQPVTYLSRMLDIELFGLNPRGHHLMNLYLHLLNVFLLFSFLSDTTGALGRSAWVAAFFAVHPLQVEPVAWITARKDVLSTFFFLLTLIAYRDSIRRPSVVSRLFVVFLFLMALMSKPISVVLPFVLLLLDFWPLDRLQKSVFLEKWPLFALSTVFAAIPFIGQPNAVTHSPASAIVSNFLMRYVSYFKKVFYPFPLAVYSPIQTLHLPLWQVVFAAFFLISISIFVIQQARRRPYLAVGWLWFLGTLVPSMGLVRLEDRFMYIPMIGLLLILVWGLWDLVAKWIFPRAVLALGGGFLFLIATSLTWAQERCWENSFTLFEHSLQVDPDNFLARNQLCAAWMDRGNWEKATVHCTEALKINPDLAEVHYNLGLVLSKQGKADEATAHYKEALRLKPESLDAHNNLAYLLLKKGDLKAARQHLSIALHLQPDFPATHNNLGIVLAEQGRWEEAARQYQEAIRLKPDYPEAHNNLAYVLMKQGKTEEAGRHLARIHQRQNQKR